MTVAYYGVLLCGIYIVYREKISILNEQEKEKGKRERKEKESKNERKKMQE